MAAVMIAKGPSDDVDRPVEPNAAPTPYIGRYRDADVSGPGVLNAKTGVQQWKFGSPIPKSGVKKVTEQGGLVLYSAGKTKVGSSHTDVTLIYFDNRLLSISLETNNGGDNVAMFRTLVEAYGQPYQKNKFIEKYIWRSDNIELTFDINEIRDTAAATFTHRATEQAYFDSRAKGAKKAVSDLE